METTALKTASDTSQAQMTHLIPDPLALNMDLRKTDDLSS